jgi:hypothetical protein
VPNQQPIDDVLQSTVEILRNRIRAIQEESRAQVARIEQAIQALQHGEGSSAQAPAASTDQFPPVRPGQFRDMEKFHAMVDYLKDRPGQIHVSKIRKDLIAGGAVLSEKTRPGMAKATSEKVNLIITAKSNHNVLGFDEEKRTIWLKSLATYTGPPKRRH